MVNSAPGIGSSFSFLLCEKWVLIN
jgi:hypothetical protein